MMVWSIVLIPTMIFLILVIIVVVIKKKHYIFFKTQTKERIVFSITTLPSRIGILHETVKELLSSTICPDVIYVNIPYECIRLKEKYIVPENLIQLSKSDPRIVLNRCIDVGPATKLIPTLSKELNPNTIIITADDDIFYPRNYHEELLHHSIKYPTIAFGYRGVVFRQGNPIYTASYPGVTQIIEGFTGAIYRRNFFDETVRNVPLNDCWFTDDIWISAHLAKRQITRKLLLGEPHNVGMGRKGNPITQKNNSKYDPLHVENHRGRNKSCYEHVQHFF
jgi:hypothetical protein